jgi:hypothetical protein
MIFQLELDHVEKIQVIVLLKLVAFVHGVIIIKMILIGYFIKVVLLHGKPVLLLISIKKIILLLIKYIIEYYIIF